MKFDFARELYNKLSPDEWSLCSRYIEKAQGYYDQDRDSEARECLLDAIAVFKANGEYSAANKIEYYLRFC